MGGMVLKVFVLCVLFVCFFCVFVLCVFLTPDCVAGLTPDSFDFAINIDSFQEMTENQVAQYIRLVQAVVKQDGYFLRS